MSTHNLCFHGELKKNILEFSSKLTPSWSTADTESIQVPSANVSLIVTLYGLCWNTGANSFLDTLMATVAVSI